MRELVAQDPALAGALEPAERPGARRARQDKVHLVAIPLLTLPLRAAPAPRGAVLRGAPSLHEKRDAAPHVKPSEERVQMLAALEDHLVQNPFTAVGLRQAGAASGA